MLCSDDGKEKSLAMSRALGSLSGYPFHVEKEYSMFKVYIYSWIAANSLASSSEAYKEKD